MKNNQIDILNIMHKELFFSVSDNCLPNWTSHSNRSKCFRHFTEEKSYEKATQACGDFGGQLAMPKNRQINNKLQEIYR